MAQLAAHGIPELYQLVVNPIQFLALPVVPFALGFPGGTAQLVIGAELQRGKLGQGVGLTLEFNLGGSDELGIGTDQAAFLLQILHHLRGKGPGSHLRILERNRAVLFLQPFAEGRCQQRLGPFLLQRLEFGQFLMIKCHFPVVELVPGVDVPADLGNGAHGTDGFAFGFVFLQECLLRFFKGFCIGQTLQLRCQAASQVVHINAAVFDLRKGHGVSPPFGISTHYSIFYQNWKHLYLFLQIILFFPDSGKTASLRQRDEERLSG